MNDILIPTLLFWQNNNTWYGSKGQARFFIQPVTAPPPEGEGSEPFEPHLAVELWRGPLNKRLSQMLTSATFPLTAQGLEQTTAWLEDQARQLNAAPQANPPHHT